MTMSHDEVVRRFAKREENKSGDVEWRGYDVYCHTDTIFSFGSHFPLAYHLGEVDGEHVFLKNGDEYSPSTTQHQGYVQAYCSGPTIPFSALMAAGISPRNVGLSAIVDYSRDTIINLVRVDGELLKGDYYREPNTWTPFAQPRQGMYVKTGEYNGIEHGYWHILGGALIKYYRGDVAHFYLCGMDHGSYFLCELPGEATDLNRAYQLLKPADVRIAENDGMEVLRQGEWFFVPTDYDDGQVADRLGKKSVTDLRKELRQSPLPMEDRSRNMHVVRNIQMANGAIYCKGTVYHRRVWSGEATREHPSLKLGDQWYMAIHNTALNSWSARGSVD